MESNLGLADEDSAHLPGTCEIQLENFDCVCEKRCPLETAGCLKDSATCAPQFIIFSFANVDRWQRAGKAANWRQNRLCTKTEFHLNYGDEPNTMSTHAKTYSVKRIWGVGRHVATYRAPDCTHCADATRNS